MQNPPAILAHVAPSRIGWVVCCGLVLILGGVVLYRFDPAQSSFFPRCFFYAATGLACPGCGATRGIHELLHGHFMTAARFNFLVFPLVPLVLGSWFGLRRFGWNQIRTDLNQIVTKTWVIWLVGMGIVLFGIARNLPVYPLTFLAPPVSQVQQGALPTQVLAQ